MVADVNAEWGEHNGQRTPLQVNQVPFRIRRLLFALGVVDAVSARLASHDIGDYHHGEPECWDSAPSAERVLELYGPLFSIVSLIDKGFLDLFDRQITA